MIPKFLMMDLPPGSPGVLHTKRSVPMSIDIKAKVEELAAKLQQDPALIKSFQQDPVKTLERLIGADLPDEQLQPLVTGIKAKLAAIGLGGALDGLKKLF